MSNSKARGFETVDSEGKLFVFRANFGFLQLLKESSDDSIFTTAELVNEGDPDSIRSILACSLVSIADNPSEEMTDTDKQETIEGFITKHGLQECCILANHLLTHAMVGDIKKNQIERHQTVTRMIESLLISRSKSLKNHALLWVYVSMISMICVWLSTKLLGRLIA